MSGRKFRKRGRDSAPNAIPSDWQSTVWRGQKPIGKKFRKGVNGLPVSLRNHHYGQTMPPQPWRGEIGPNNPRALFSSRKRYKSQTFGTFRKLPEGPLNYGAYYKDKYPIREVPAPPPTDAVPGAHADSYYWGDMYTPGRGYGPGNDPAYWASINAMNAPLPRRPGPMSHFDVTGRYTSDPPPPIPAWIQPPPGPPPNINPGGWYGFARPAVPGPGGPGPGGPPPPIPPWGPPPPIPPWGPPPGPRFIPEDDALQQLADDMAVPAGADDDGDVQMFANPVYGQAPAGPPAGPPVALPHVDIDDLYDPPAPGPALIPGSQSAVVPAPAAVVSSSSYPAIAAIDIEQRRQAWRDYHKEVTRDKIQQLKSVYADDDKKMETKMQEAIATHNRAMQRIENGDKDKLDPPNRASVYARAVRANKLDKFRNPAVLSLSGPPLVQAADGNWVDKTDILNGKDQFGTSVYPGQSFSLSEDPLLDERKDSTGGEPTWLEKMRPKARNAAVRAINGTIGVLGTAADLGMRGVIGAIEGLDSVTINPPPSYDDAVYDYDSGVAYDLSSASHPQSKRDSVSQAQTYQQLAYTSPVQHAAVPVVRPPPPTPPPRPPRGHPAEIPARRPRRTADRDISSQGEDDFVYVSGLPTGYRARGFGFQDQLLVTPGYSTGISDKPTADSDRYILYMNADLDRRSTQAAGRGGPGFTPRPINPVGTFADQIVAGVTPQMFNLRTGDFTPQNPTR